MKFQPKHRTVDVGFADPETEPGDGATMIRPAIRAIPVYDEDGPLPQAVYIVEPDGVAWRLPMRLFLILFEPSDDVSRGWLKAYHERIVRNQERRYLVPLPDGPGPGPGPRGVN